MNAEVKKELGRGLASLLGDDTNDYAQLDKLRQSKNVPIESIIPGRFQPRVDFDKDALNRLADSIRAKGILQPLLVRRDSKNPNQFELVAGERRWRAAQIAKLHEVPVVIKDLTDRESLEIGLIENIQRADLNPVEEALGYYRLMNEFNHTQEQMAATLGKSRSYLANMLRLLDLPKSVKDLLRGGQLSIGHGKLLIGRKDADALAANAVQKNLNVRQLQNLLAGEDQGEDDAVLPTHSFEDRAGFSPAAPSEFSQLTPSNSNQPKNIPTPDINHDGPDADTRDLEKQLSQLLGMRVTIKFAGKSGQLTVHYNNLDQLDDIIRRFKK